MILSFKLTCYLPFNLNYNQISFCFNVFVNLGNNANSRSGNATLKDQDLRLRDPESANFLGGMPLLINTTSSLLITFQINFLL